MDAPVDLAARTRRVRLFPDETDLPLRPPAVLAKAVASLDVVSGGRVDLGLGAGSLHTFAGEVAPALRAEVARARRTVRP